jgi:hypothetical protein
MQCLSTLGDTFSVPCFDTDVKEGLTMYGLLTAKAVQSCHRCMKLGIWNYNALRSCIRALANVSNPGMRRSSHEQSRGINDNSRQ